MIFSARLGSLISGAVQFFIILWFLFQSKYKTWSQRFFIVYLVFSGSYCFLEYLFRTAANKEFALLLVKPLFIIVTFIPVWPLLFSVALQEKPRAKWLVYLVAPLIFTPIVWGYLIKDVFQNAWGWQSDVFTTAWVGWLLYFFSYSSLFLYKLYKAQLILKEEGDLDLSFRLRIIFYAFIALIIIATSTNIAVLLLGLSIPPLLVPLFFIPSLFIAYALMRKSNGKKTTAPSP